MEKIEKVMGMLQGMEESELPPELQEEEEALNEELEEILGNPENNIKLHRGYRILGTVLIENKEEIEPAILTRIKEIGKRMKEIKAEGMKINIIKKFEEFAKKKEEWAPIIFQGLKKLNLEEELAQVVNAILEMMEEINEKTKEAQAKLGKSSAERIRERYCEIRNTGFSNDSAMKILCAEIQGGNQGIAGSLIKALLS